MHGDLLILVACHKRRQVISQETVAYLMCLAVSMVLKDVVSSPLLFSGVAQLRIVFVTKIILWLLIFYFYFCRTREEKEDWLEALFQTIKELYQRKSSLRVEIFRPLDAEIGAKQPRLMKLESCAKCTECAQPFSLMMRKKHHCRACGSVSWPARSPLTRPNIWHF